VREDHRDLAVTEVGGNSGANLIAESDVVWVKRWAPDTRSEIDGAGMVDPRVTHLWGAGNVVGQECLDRFGSTSVGWTMTSSC
jgi:hypothetical protein